MHFYFEPLFLPIVLGGNFIHSYGRLVHFQQVITRRDQLLPPDDIRGPGKMECTRKKAVVYFSLEGIIIGRDPTNNLFYRNFEKDSQRDHLMFRTSNLNQFQNTEGYCTIMSTSYFYLFLLPGEYPLCIIITIITSYLSQNTKLMSLNF